MGDRRMAMTTRIVALLVLLASALLIAEGAVAGKSGAEAVAAASIPFVDQTGRTVSAKDYTGKPSLVVFGFTSCPSICPTMLNEIAGRMNDLGSQADALNFIFISVDPEQDTPQVLNDYVGYFDKRIIGLTGRIEDIGAMAQYVGAHFQKVQLGPDRYTVDHSTMAFLMDRNWQRTGLLTLDPSADQQRAVAKLRALIDAATH
jgi:protein SCO1